MTRARSQDHEKDINYRLTRAIWTSDLDTVNRLASHARLRTDWRFPMPRSTFRPKLNSPVSVDEIETGLDDAAALLGSSNDQIRAGPFEAAMLTGREHTAIKMFAGAHPLDRSGSRVPSEPSVLTAVAWLASPPMIWTLTEVTDQAEWEQPVGKDGRCALDHLIDRGGKALIGLLRSVALIGDLDWIRSLAVQVPRSAWEERWGEWGSGVDALYQQGGEALAAYQAAMLERTEQQSQVPRRTRRI